MVVFISMPMSGLTKEQIDAGRQRAIDWMNRTAPDDDIEFIDGYTGEEKNEKNMPVRYLGDSIVLMADADIILMAKGWKDARGCNVEHLIAERYGIPIEYEDDD